MLKIGISVAFGTKSEMEVIDACSQLTLWSWTFCPRLKQYQHTLLLQCHHTRHPHYYRCQARDRRSLFYYGHE